MGEYYLLTYRSGSQYHAQVAEPMSLYQTYVQARQSGGNGFSAFRLLQGKQPQRVRIEILENGRCSYLLLYDGFDNLIDTVGG